MKRFFILAAMLVTVTSCFAYYGSSSDSGFTSFLGFIFVVSGVLQIILFFKVWGMTTDIMLMKYDLKVIKQEYLKETNFNSSEDVSTYLRENLIIGNMDKVKRVLLLEFKYQITSGYNNTLAKAQTVTDKTLTNEEWALNQSIRPYIEQLQSRFDKIDEKVPNYILHMETFGDYYKLF